MGKKGKSKPVQPIWIPKAEVKKARSGEVRMLKYPVEGTDMYVVVLLDWFGKPGNPDYMDELYATIKKHNEDGCIGFFALFDVDIKDLADGNWVPVNSGKVNYRLHITDI